MEKRDDCQPYSQKQEAREKNTVLVGVVEVKRTPAY